MVQYNLSTMYNQGIGVAKDDVEASTWYRKAAQQGLAAAQDNLAVMYAEGKGIPEGYAWFSVAATNSDEFAKRVLPKKQRPN